MSDKPQSLLTLVAEEASELAVTALHCVRGRSDLVELFVELIDVIGYFELAARRPDAHAVGIPADNLQRAIFTAVVVHQFKLQDRSLDAERLRLTYNFLMQLRDLLLGATPRA